MHISIKPSPDKVQSSTPSSKDSCSAKFWRMLCYQQVFPATFAIKELEVARLIHMAVECFLSFWWRPSVRGNRTWPQHQVYGSASPGPCLELSRDNTHPCDCVFQQPFQHWAGREPEVLQACGVQFKSISSRPTEMDWWSAVQLWTVAIHIHFHFNFNEVHHHYQPLGWRGGVYLQALATYLSCKEAEFFPFCKKLRNKDTKCFSTNTLRE